jgi:hypothetical protein
MDNLKELDIILAESLKRIATIMYALERTVKDSDLADSYKKHLNDVEHEIHQGIGEFHLKSFFDKLPDDPIQPE